MGEIKAVLYDPERINYKARVRAYELMMHPDENREISRPRKSGTWAALAFAGISAMLLAVTLIRLATAQ